MGWLPSFGGSKPEEKPVDAVYEPPMRNKRDKCYAARDAFFTCLEQNNILDAIKDEDKSKAACGALNQEFERNCATAWVSANSP
jgi:cytochrome c oxidase assembly factor 6